MLFTSYGFLGFVAVLILVYYWIPRRYQWRILLVADYLFYAAAGVTCVPYILTTTVTTYAAAVFIGRNMDRQDAYLIGHKAELSGEERRAYKERQQKRRFWCVAACVLLNIGILAAVKCGKFDSLILPLGISFYTLQSLGYLIDVYRGTVPAEKNLFRFALFVSFFPQLIQGPISRFGDLAKSLYGGHAFDSRTVCYGLQRILWGYFKKLVIADRILMGVGTIIGSAELYQGAYIFVGMLFYTVELYADFTGGIDIAIGIAQALGITVEENFRRPYFSKSLKEYWRRWHISMCSWFRDYVFYPVSVCRPMQKLVKYVRGQFGAAAGKRLPVYVSSSAVWLATGLWHGISLNFVVWGLANWFVLMVSEELEPVYAGFHRRFHVKKSMVYQLFQMFRTFLLVCCLNLFDCYASFGTTAKMFFSMFTVQNWNILWDGSLMNIGLQAHDYVVLAIGVALLVAVSVAQRGGSVRNRIARYAYPVRFAVWYGMFLAVLLMGVYGIGYDASQFIYNRF